MPAVPDCAGSTVNHGDKRAQLSAPDPDSLAWSGVVNPISLARAPGPSLGRPRPTNADSRHPRVTTPTPLWPGLPELICDTGRVMPAPGVLTSTSDINGIGRGWT